MRSIRFLGAVAAILLLLPVLIAACSDDENASRRGIDGAPASFDEALATDIAFAEGPPEPPSLVGRSFAAESQAAIGVEAEPPFAPQPEPAAAPSPQEAPPAVLQVIERRIISNGFIAITVDAVPPAVSQVEGLADSLGGFVEQLSVFGQGERAQAEITIRVPQDRFSDALERLRQLGDVQEENLNSQDVTEQFIDLEARLRSTEREEESLLNLLQRADTVQEILTIERELARVRSEIERFQGQLNFLERRVALATITVSLFGPEARITEPPSANLTLEVSNVTRTVNELREFVASLDGVIDRVTVNVNQDEEFAAMSVRVPRADFVQALASIEGRGEVITKQLREGEGSFDPDAPLPDEPDARIDLRLIEQEDGSDAGLIAAIVVPSVAVALALVAGAIALQGRRRRPPTP